MSRLKAVRPFFNWIESASLFEGYQTDSPIRVGLCPVQTIYEYKVSSLMLTATRAGSPVSALCHIRPNGAGWVAIGRSSISAVGLMISYNTTYLYYAQFKGFAQLTKTTACCTGCDWSQVRGL